MRKLYCYSHNDFDMMCEKEGWNDDNIPDNAAFISICGTPDCQKYYLGEIENHWFNSSPQVLNLDFDDISTDSIEWHGHIFYGLTIEQAREAVEFIERNKGKDIYIHCRAGQSRSQGFVRYILDCYPEFNYETRQDNPCNTPNIDVVCKLKALFRELGYDDKNPEINA